jgi:hypothetical protein
VQPVVFHRFEHVVDGVHLEGIHGVFVVGGHEDDHGHVVALEFFDHLEAVHPRHLDIQKQQIRVVLGNGGESLRSIGALGDHVNLRQLLQANRESAAGKLFVVDNYGAESVHAASLVA